ncbi:MAG: hypothetical protein EA392_03990 [Cryomorphaceae bacterium]|nr:MAG: hypothetical protein EA392_03990 [Cryomorphaceae bacterium]
MKKLLLATGLLVFFILPELQAQDSKKPDLGSIHGNIQLDGQYYREDSLINAIPPPEQVGLMGFANLIYTRGNLTAGVRFETYTPALLGYPASPDLPWTGSGIGYRFAQYSTDMFDVTIGNFYEQFGTGMILRAFEERGLGVDNAIDGFRLKVTPHRAVTITGLYGKQRRHFDNGFTKGAGIVRGINTDVNLTSLFDSAGVAKTRIFVGGSFVSKYQEDRNPLFNYPENVGAWAARASILRGGFALRAEYVYKDNDPSRQNSLIVPDSEIAPGLGLYKPGQGIDINMSYSTRGFGASLTAKSLDNMSFQSDRNAGPFDLNINYIPATTVQHTYNLPATLYPYATQPNGEVAFMGEIFYTMKRGSKLGGKYGTKIEVNYAVAMSPDTTLLNDMDGRRFGYETRLFAIGDNMYFQDFNISVSRKLSRKVKAKYMYINLVYNNDIIQGAFDYRGEKVSGTVYSDIHLVDMDFRIKSNNLRVELQHLRTNQHLGSWATVLAEYTISPSWFFTVMNQWNYGNKNSDERFHFPFVAAGYITGGSRIMVSYGRQRAGVFCVGGICRTVPASNGLTVQFTSTF